MTDSISLIGMPGAGKSTIGVILAKLTGLRFVDTDLDIQVRAGATLQEILERHDHMHLRALEQAVLLDIDLEHAVIATGGSVVYSAPAVQRLAAAGPVVYLRADLATLERRVQSAPPRGIACAADQPYAEVYRERTPLYQHYADITIACSDASAEEIARKVLQSIGH